MNTLKDLTDEAKDESTGSAAKCENCANLASHRAWHHELGGCYVCRECLTSHVRELSSIRVIRANESSSAHGEPERCPDPMCRAYSGHLPLCSIQSVDHPKRRVAPMSESNVTASEDSLHCLGYARLIQQLKCSETNNGMHVWRAAKWTDAREKLWCCQCALLATDIIDEALKAHNDLKLSDALS